MGEMQPDRAAQALAVLSDLRIVRIWQLRHSLTAYDAAYVALAESLGARLITRDGRMASCHGHHAKIKLMA